MLCPVDQFSRRDAKGFGKPEENPYRGLVDAALYQTDKSPVDPRSMCQLLLR